MTMLLNLWLFDKANESQPHREADTWAILINFMPAGKVMVYVNKSNVAKGKITHLPLMVIICGYDEEKGNNPIPI